MKALFIFFGALIAIALIAFVITLICFFKCFYMPPRKPLKEDEYPIPPGKVYEPFRERMIKWMKEMRTTPCEDVWITSFDGLKLHGSYYKCRDNAPTEIMFHGYRGNAERDLCGGVARCFSLGRNVIVVDQRCAGKSEGSVITFGINEHKDCLAWIDRAVKLVGEDCPIILSGVSMGAATVMMASGHKLPKNVVHTIADCGYTSPKAIIKKVIRDMHLPPDIMYPFVKLAARWFGHFDLEEYSPIEAVRESTVPIIFYHGDTDDFVPWDMSSELFDACTAKKRFVTIEGAGHGLAFPQNKEKYLTTLAEFSADLGVE